MSGIELMLTFDFPRKTKSMCIETNRQCMPDSFTGVVVKSPANVSDSIYFTNENEQNFKKSEWIQYFLAMWLFPTACFQELHKKVYENKTTHPFLELSSL